MGNFIFRPDDTTGKEYILDKPGKRPDFLQFVPASVKWVVNSEESAPNIKNSSAESNAIVVEKNVFTSDWKLPEQAREWLTKELKSSSFPLRTGIHIEDRPGMVNFSIVGRNATMGERKLYVRYDTANEERVKIAKEFKKQFPDIEAVVGGETGIDIFPVGKDKAQIVEDFDKKDKLYFFGDRMDKDGNDYSLSKKVHYARSVTGWQQTKETLCYLQEAGIAA